MDWYFPSLLFTCPYSYFSSLDRTNFVQDILSRLTLEQYLLLVRRELLHSNTLWSNHRELWAENGDALSRIYAGTGALNTSYTRSGKRTLAGVLSDATKSAARAYINNFQDKGKQTAIDIFLVRSSFVPFSRSCHVNC
jgi:synaptojanin